MSEPQGGKICFLAEQKDGVTKNEDRIVSIEANRHCDVLYGRRCRPEVTQLVKPSDGAGRYTASDRKTSQSRYLADVCRAGMQAKDIA